MLPSQRPEPRPRLLQTTPIQNTAPETIPNSELDPSFVAYYRWLDTTASNSWGQQHNNLGSGSDNPSFERVNDSFAWGAHSHRQRGPTQPDADQSNNLGVIDTDEPFRDSSERRWDPEVQRAKRKPEPGMRALRALTTMHDSDHVLYEVSISGNPIIDPSTSRSSRPSVTTAGALNSSNRLSMAATSITAPSTAIGKASVTAAQPVPDAIIPHVPPTSEELRDAIPPPSALYCRQHHGWVIIAVTAAAASTSAPTTASHLSAYWCPDPEERDSLVKLPDTTLHAGKHFPNNTSSDRNPADSGWNRQALPEKKMHHLHRYPNTVGSGGYPALRHEVLSSTVKPSTDVLPKSGGGANTKSETQGRQNKVRGDNDIRSGWERTPLSERLDLYLCCQCRTRVFCSPAGCVIPGIIPSDALEKYIHERVSNPKPGQSKEQSAFASLEIMLRIVEEPLWLGNQHYLPLTGKIFTAKIGWSESSRQIFDAMGFTVEDRKLIPPSLEITTPQGRAARSRLLRVWIELGAVLAEYCLRYSKITPSRKNYIRLTKSRRDDLISEQSKCTSMTLDEADFTCFNPDPLASYAPPPHSTAGVNANREPPRSVQAIRHGTLSPSRTSTHYDDGSTARTSMLAVATKFGAKPTPINTKEPTPLEGEVEKLRSEFEQMKAKRDMVKSERDQLRTERDKSRFEGRKYRVERDEARTKAEKYRAERDKAIEQCEGVAETCRELRKRIEGLERALKERDETSRQVLNLIIASLQAGSTPDQLGSSLEAQS